MVFPEWEFFMCYFIQKYVFQLIFFLIKLWLFQVKWFPECIFLSCFCRGLCGDLFRWIFFKSRILPAIFSRWYIFLLRILQDRIFFSENFPGKTFSDKICSGWIFSKIFQIQFFYYFFQWGNFQVDIILMGLWWNYPTEFCASVILGGWILEDGTFLS